MHGNVGRAIIIIVLLKPTECMIHACMHFIIIKEYFCMYNNIIHNFGFMSKLIFLASTCMQGEDTTQT